MLMRLGGDRWGRWGSQRRPWARDLIYKLFAAMAWFGLIPKVWKVDIISFLWGATQHVLFTMGLFCVSFFPILYFFLSPWFRGPFFRFCTFFSRFQIDHKFEQQFQQFTLCFLLEFMKNMSESLSDYCVKSWECLQILETILGHT